LHFSVTVGCPAPVATTVSSWDPVGEVGEIVAVVVNEPLEVVVVGLKVPVAGAVKAPVTAAVGWNPEPLMMRVSPK